MRDATQALAKVLNTIPELCANADDTYDLAATLVAKGVRALDAVALDGAEHGYPRIPAWDLMPWLQSQQEQR